MNKMLKSLMVGTMALFVMAGAAQAGVITIVDIPSSNSDVNSGFDSANTYTHALDIGASTLAAYSINGVPITQVNSLSGNDLTSGNAYLITSSNPQFHGGNTNTRTDGNMSKMLTDMFVPYSGSYSLTLSGLTAGTQYSTRIYYRPWTNNGTRNATLTFNGDGTPAPIAINEDAGSSAHYVAYDFTASGTSVKVDINTSAWHLYGASNQVIPEPASGLLLIAGAVGLGLLRRKLRG